MSLVKDVRFVVFAVLLFISLYLLLMPLVFKDTGVVVTFLTEDSKCSALKDGDIITGVGGLPVKNSEDFRMAVETVKVDEYVTMIVNKVPSGCIAARDGYLGIAVKDVESGNLKFGIDTHGGTRVLLKPKENITSILMEEIVNTLNTRINLYGLKEVRVNTLGQNLIQIEMAGTTGDEVKNFLAKQGKFEAKILETIELSNNMGKINLGDKQYPVELINSKVKINDSLYGVNESFYLENIKIDITNSTNKNVVILVNVFGGKDVVAVYTDPQSSSLRSTGNGYEFSFIISISKESAEKFAKITKNQPFRFVGNERYIVPPIIFFLDDKAVSQLNIAADLAGKALTTPSIQGFRETKEDANSERLRLQTILRSGGLPTELEIVKVDVISPTAGKELISSTIFVVLGAAIAVSSIVLIRYRKLKIAIPMILISFSEIVLILGVAASQLFAGIAIVATVLIGILKREMFGLIGWLAVVTMIVIASTTVLVTWTLDIAAIAGLIAIIGTGVNQMIIITDQLLLEREKTLRERHKIAMSIIWSSAALVVFAMLPLLIMGIGMVKGFAIATVVGVMFGVLITRPAYAAILERVEKLNE